MLILSVNLTKNLNKSKKLIPMIFFFFRTYHHAVGINPGDNLTIGPSKHLPDLTPRVLQVAMLCSLSKSVHINSEFYLLENNSLKKFLKIIFDWSII